MFKKMMVFVKTVECGSFTKAGEILRIAPSSVSRQINRIECELNATFFNRSTRNLTLTPAGQAYYEKVKRILAEVDSIHESIKLHSANVGGNLNVTALETFGRLYVSPLIPEFIRKYPDIRVELDLNNRVVDLYKDRFDIAIRIGVPPDSSLIVKLLAINEMVLCASLSYLKKHGAPQDPNDLRKHNCLTLSRPSQITVWQFQQGDSTMSVPVKGNILSVGGEPLAEAARQGAGITMLARWLVDNDLQTGRLLPILTDWTIGNTNKQPSTVYATYIRDKSAATNINAFVDFIRQKIPKKFTVN